MGPDEYHEHGEESPGGGTKNNTYTNLMVLWAFQKSIEIIDILKPEDLKLVKRKLVLEEVEIKKWHEVQDKMEIEINQDGILEQFKGYFKLPEFEMQKYIEKYGATAARIDRVLKMEGLSPDHFKVAKQADTLMTFYNIPEQEVKEMMVRCGYQPNPNLLQINYDYYLPRTSHGSTLSRVVHCYLATLFGNSKLAWEFFQEAIQSDYIDIQGGTTQEGIHTGVMGATVLIVLKAYAGLTFKNGIPQVKSALPPQ